MLNSLFLGLPDAVLVLDCASHVIANCNTAAERIFGCTREEMIGRAPEFLHVDSAEGREYIAAVTAALRASESGAVVAQYDGSPRNGEYPTRLWRRGELVVDPVMLTLVPYTGKLALITGLYDLRTVERPRT